MVNSATFSVATGASVSRLPLPSSSTSSIFQPISLLLALEARLQRKRTDELPATPAGKLYCTSCQLVSDTAPEVDHRVTHMLPFVETWTATGSFWRVRSQRLKRRVREEELAQLIGGVVAYLTLRL